MGVKYTCPLCGKTLSSDGSLPSPVCPKCRIAMQEGEPCASGEDAGATVAAPVIPPRPAGGGRLKIARPLDSGVPTGDGAMQTQAPGEMFLNGLEAGVSGSFQMPVFSGTYAAATGDYGVFSPEAMSGRQSVPPGQEAVGEELLEQARKQAEQIMADAEKQALELAEDLRRQAEKQINEQLRQIEEEHRGELQKRYQSLELDFQNRKKELELELKNRAPDGRGEDGGILTGHPSEMTELRNALAELRKKYDEACRRAGEAEQRFQDLEEELDGRRDERSELENQWRLEADRKQMKVHAGQVKRYFCHLNLIVLVCCYALLMAMETSGWRTGVSWGVLMVACACLVAVFWGMVRCVRDMSVLAAAMREAGKTEAVEPGPGDHSLQ